MENLIGITILIIFGVYVYVFIDKTTKKVKRTMKKFGISSNSKTTNQKTFTPMSEEEKKEEAKRIAEKIKTPKGLESLQERIDNLEEKIDEYEDENSYGVLKSHEKYEILQMAYDMAMQKTYRYYFADFCECSVDMPLEVLNTIGKLIAPKQYEQIPDEYKECYDEITLEDAITYDNDELKEEYAQQIFEECPKAKLQDLKKIRKILESEELSEEERKKQFNELVQKSKYLQEELELDEYDDMEPYDVYLDQLAFSQAVDELEKYHIPYAQELVSAGYDTLDKLLKLTKKDLMKIHGIGDKKSEEILRMINRLKERKGEQ